MAARSRFRYSLQQALTIPYVILIVALALALGALSYRAGSEAVDKVSEHLLIETVGRIGKAVDRHIAGSGAVLEAAFPEGVPVAANIDAELAALRTRFWIATSLHLDPNNYVYYGNRLGQSFGLYRRSRAEGEMRIKLHEGENRQYHGINGISGPTQPAVRESRLFDPRTRPWYQAGLAGPQHTWTPVYIDFVTGELVATRARRVAGEGGQFEGVVATDVSLRGLNDFVKSLDTSPNGLAFIVEPNGDLIASSVTPNVRTLADGNRQRLLAGQSSNPLVASIFAEIQKRLKLHNPPGAQTFNFNGPQGEVIHAAFDWIKDDAGLQWITVVAMPRSDFMAGVTGNILKTAAAGALAVLLAMGIGLGILRMLASDLRLLTEAARRVGEGHLNWPLHTWQLGEIGDLARSFEVMQLRLQTDNLTQLANREAFMLRLQEKINSAAGVSGPERFAVLFVDLNHFKSINDHYGHDMGDKVLVEIGLRLRARVRAQDFVARLSGDEFAVLLDVVGDRDGLERVRTQVQLALKEPLKALGEISLEDIDFGGSVGDAMFPEDGRDAETLMRKADRRMYNQKYSDRANSKVSVLRRVSDSRF